MDKKEETYQLVQVPTGSALAIQTPEGEQIIPEQAMVEILNKLDKLIKSIA
jgi:hypothetical protein